jgi:hypothetical protein
MSRSDTGAAGTFASHLRGRRSNPFQATASLHGARGNRPSRSDTRGELAPRPGRLRRLSRPYRSGFAADAVVLASTPAAFARPAPPGAPLPPVANADRHLAQPWRRAVGGLGGRACPFDIDQAPRRIGRRRAVHPQATRPRVIAGFAHRIADRTFAASWIRPAQPIVAAAGTSRQVNRPRRRGSPSACPVPARLRRTSARTASPGSGIPASVPHIDGGGTPQIAVGSFSSGSTCSMPVAAPPC